MRNYFLGKLSDINFQMAIHEGNAYTRLASQAINIYKLPTSEVPENYIRQYKKLICLIEVTISRLPAPGLTPTKLQRIQNKTAAKYLKLLFEIQDEIREG